MGCGMLTWFLGFSGLCFVSHACVETCSSFVWSLVLVSHTGRLCRCSSLSLWMHLCSPTFCSLCVSVQFGVANAL